MVTLTMTIILNHLQLETNSIIKITLKNTFTQILINLIHQFNTQIY